MSEDKGFYNRPLNESISELMAKFRGQKKAEAPISQDVQAPVDAPLQLATRGSRLEAKFVDGLISAVVSIVVGAIIGFEKLTTPALCTEDDWMIVALACLALVGANAYFFSRSGQTIGKMFSGIRVVRIDGSRCELARWIFLRGGVMALVGAIPVVGGIAYLIGILLIFQDEQKCLHDRIAQTIVVNI